MHYHFAKLYIDSYVLRGLPEINPTIPDHFLETASSAVGAATSIINLLLEDRDLQMAQARVPHYFHGMVAFACMFLLKVATKHSEQLFVDTKRFRILIAGLAQQFKVTDVGKEHLIHRMAEGLEKMADMLGEKSRQKLQPGQGLAIAQQTQHYFHSNAARPTGQEGAPAVDLEQMDSNAFDFGLGYNPFFNFDEIGMGDPVYPFVA